jgi:hypothetical protein
MAKEQVLGFKSARWLEEVDNEHHERMQDREHRPRSCDDSSRRCDSQAGWNFRKGQVLGTTSLFAFQPEWHKHDVTQSSWIALSTLSRVDYPCVDYFLHDLRLACVAQMLADLIESIRDRVSNLGIRRRVLFEKQRHSRQELICAGQLEEVRAAGS